MAIAELLDPNPTAHITLRWILFRALHTMGELDKAKRAAEKIFAIHGPGSYFTEREEYCWILRQQGKATEALALANRWIQEASKSDEHELYRIKMLLERAHIHVGELLGPA